MEMPQREGFYPRFSNCFESFQSSGSFFFTQQILGLTEEVPGRTPSVAQASPSLRSGRSPVPKQIRPVFQAPSCPDILGPFSRAGAGAASETQAWSPICSRGLVKCPPQVLRIVGGLTPSIHLSVQKKPAICLKFSKLLVITR